MKRFFIVRLIVFELCMVLFLSLILSGLIYFDLLKTDFLDVAILFMHIINIAILSFIVARHYKERGLVTGLITGFIYNALSLIVRILTDGALNGIFWLRILILFLVSIASGILTINIIKKE